MIAMWKWTGNGRPPFAIEPSDGQESVWDYPRPPRIERDSRKLVVRAVDAVIAETNAALRVLETASPPTFYLPFADVRTDRLVAAAGASWCEWKGRARYWSLDAQTIAWSYDDPLPGFESLRDHFGFYPGRVACTVGGIRVEPQPGGFYAGWITPEIVGPWKGADGTEGW
jgi:uncharacterized protein (DUF427 family)